jgi:hypothetical protein
MATYSVTQGTSAIQISSTFAGFTKHNPNDPDPRQFNLSNGAGATTDVFDITFADGSGVKLTDFTQLNTATDNGSALIRNVLGIPDTAASGFGNSINLIGGINFAATYDIYDLNSGALLIDNYKPQSGAGSGYLNPYALFGYSTGSLTVEAPTTAPFAQASIGTPGSVSFAGGQPTSYVAGQGYTATAGTGQASSQYRSGGAAAGGSGGAPWVFSLLVPSQSSPVCFVHGTLIKTADGTEVPIQELDIGDRVITSKGLLPIKWIAKRTVWKQRVSKSEYKQALPVRIEAGALCEGIPRKDLLVSRGHGIWADGKVVHAYNLENDINISQSAEDEFPDCIKYYHLEFDEEVLVEANGALACSYVNENNRRYFDNYPEFISLYCSADLTARSLIRTGPRNRPSLDGHKDRVRRAWMPPGCSRDPDARNQAAAAQGVTF